MIGGKEREAQVRIQLSFLIPTPPPPTIKANSYTYYIILIARFSVYCRYFKRMHR